MAPEVPADGSSRFVDPIKRSTGSSTAGTDSKGRCERDPPIASAQSSEPRHRVIPGGHS